WSLDARRARRTAEARGRGEEPRDRTGPALWGVLGFLLLVATLAGRMDGELFVPVLLWTVWLGQALWWVVGRRARTGQPRILLDVVANIVHNGALLVIMVEACLIYATAGWYKVQGSRWQDGTAVHYPLQLEYFSPWPALADLLAASGTMVMLVTYVTVAVQVAFPFTLFNRRVKNVLLAAMITEHAAIAVVLGLPFFSLAMIAADAVFLPTSFLRRLGRAATGLRGLRVLRWRSGPALRSRGTSVSGTDAGTDAGRRPEPAPGQELNAGLHLGPDPDPQAGPGIGHPAPAPAPGGPPAPPPPPRPVAPRATALRGNLESLELLAMPRERTHPQATPGRPPRARLRTANTERAVPRPTRRTAPYRAGHDPERT